MPVEWKRIRAGLYEGRDSGGLVHLIVRTNSWWVRSCGVVRARYETLSQAKASVS